MAKDDILRALYALGGRATKQEVFEWLINDGMDISSTTVWGDALKLEGQGVITIRRPNILFKLTGKGRPGNVVKINADGTIAERISDC